MTRLASAVGRGAPYRVAVVHDARIPTTEAGITLGANLFLPINDDPVPALVTILHNSKDGIAGIGGAPYLEYFASRGYASVLVDRLGTGTSDGKERPAFDPGDGDDGVAVVQWAAAQPWCDGNVGMWGLSYGAINALRTASRRPPALKAIVAIMGMIDPERDFVHPSGERGAMGFFGLAGVWNLFIQLQPSMFGGPDAARRWEERVRQFDPWLMDAWRHPAGDPSWRSRVIDAREIDVPTFCIAGWHDLFLSGTVRAYEQIGAPKRLMVGPWMHELPNESPREPADAIALACDWWQRWLAPDAAPAGSGEDPAVVYVGGADPSWERFPSWPPRGPRLRLAATPDGALAESTGEGESTRFIRWASDRTVGALSGLGNIPLAGFGFPLDQHDDDARSLAFTTEPLVEPLVIAGTPTVDLVLGPRTTASRCVARLADVDPCGRSTLVTVGAVALPPGSTGTVTLTLEPAGYRVAASHRLRLALSDADLPTLWPSAAGKHLDIGVPVTVLNLPVGQPVGAEDVTPPPPIDLPRPFSGGDARRTWRIARDHATGVMSVTIGDEASASLDHSGDVITLERAVEITFHVGQEPGLEYLTGNGRLTITNGAGDRTVVTANTQVSQDTVAATGEVTINDALVVSRRWSG